MNAPQNIRPPATTKAINTILDDTLDWLRTADNEYAKLLAVRNGVQALYAYGDAGIAARDLISQSAIEVHGISIPAVQVALEQGIELAQRRAPLVPRPSSLKSRQPVGVSQGQPPEMLADAVEHVRGHLRSGSVPERVRKLWLGVVLARDLATAPVLKQAFLQLARQTGLHRDLGWHADEDLEHVIRWGLLGRDPFGDMGHE